MKFKKQVKRFSKKILVLTLAASIVFTSCFSSKKIDAHAGSIAAGLGAYTLYEICLYIGSLAVTTLGIGYAYENRDEIAEFGKSVIDSMSSLPAQGWLLGSSTTEGNYVYGTEALQEVQNTQWTVIQGGGNSPKNDNDGDGDKDKDDIIHTINLNGYFLLEKGAELFINHIKPMYDSWVNKEEDNILEEYFGSADDVGFTGFRKDSNGYYLSNFEYYFGGNQQGTLIDIRSTTPMFVFIQFRNNPNDYNTVYYDVFHEGGDVITNNGSRTPVCKVSEWDSKFGKEYWFKTDCPVYTSIDDLNYAIETNDFSNCDNFAKTYRIADWIAEDEAWKGHLEDISTSLRSLQDLFALSQQAASSALTTMPSADAYADMLNNLATQYAPSSNPVTNPIYYPATNPTPKLEPSVFPNYQPSVNPNPDPDDDGTETPDDGTDNPEDIEIDLDGLLSLFNILFYLIMIIIMLLYLFISCLAFIVMIFRIPASSSMLPDDMVLGFEHLKTIMIPGMNISIYGFAMALIYMFIIFAVIKLIRLEINDFKFPRSYK